MPRTRNGPVTCNGRDRAAPAGTGPARCSGRRSHPRPNRTRTPRADGQARADGPAARYAAACLPVSLMTDGREHPAPLPGQHRIEQQAAQLPNGPLLGRQARAHRGRRGDHGIRNTRRQSLQLIAGTGNCMAARYLAAIRRAQDHLIAARAPPLISTRKSRASTATPHREGQPPFQVAVTHVDKTDDPPAFSRRPELPLSSHRIGTPNSGKTSRTARRGCH